MNLNINNQIEIQLCDHLPYQYKMNYLFDLTSSVITVSYNDQLRDEACINSTGSEHWFWEESDYLRFNDLNELIYISNSISQRNMKLENKVILKALYLRLFLKDKKGFILVPMPFRYLSMKNKTLYCFNEIVFSKKDIDAYAIVEDFYFMFIEGKYCGYCIVNPLKYIKDLAQLNCNDAEYNILNRLLFYVSDNYYDKTDDDEELIFKKLHKNILNSVIKIDAFFYCFIQSKIKMYR